MVNDMLNMWHIFDDNLGKASLKEIIDRFFEFGCTTTEDGRTDVCKYRTGDFKEFPKTLSTDSALDKLSSSNEGGIEFWYKDIRFDFEVNLDPHIIPSKNHLTLRIWASQFRSYKEGDDSDVTKRVRQLLEIARPLAELSDPEYVYGTIEKFDTRPVNLSELAIDEDHVEHIFWINVFSEPIIAQIGENRLLSAPAWKVEKLSTGSILLVVNDYPRGYVNEAMEIEEYLQLDTK